MNGLERIEKKILKYKARYSNESIISLLKILYFVNLQLSRALVNKLYRFCTTNKSYKLNVLFKTKGGMGDFLFSANYITYFVEFAGRNNVNIDLSYARGIDIAQTIFNNNKIIDSIIEPKKIKSYKYDLIIDLMCFPNILLADYKRIEKIVPNLIPMLKFYTKFKEENYHLFYDYSDALCNSYALLNGFNRLQQLDIGRFLNIDKYFKLKLSSKLDKNEVINKFNLKDKKIITINRSVDAKNKKSDSTKLWKLENYNRLIQILKKDNPEFVFVQLGATPNYSKIIENADINLVGKTSLEELKVILEYATIHIDGEGGLVHLRKVLTNKPSVVLFQSTNSQFYGYFGNINIQSEACQTGCEHILKDWQGKCLKELSIPPCTEDITPENVKEKIKEYIINADKLC